MLLLLLSRLLLTWLTLLLILPLAVALVVAARWAVVEGVSQVTFRVVDRQWLDGLEQITGSVLDLGEVDACHGHGRVVAAANGDVSAYGGENRCVKCGRWSKCAYALVGDLLHGGVFGAMFVFIRFAEFNYGGRRLSRDPANMPLLKFCKQYEQRAVYDGRFNCNVIFGSSASEIEVSS